MHTRTQTLRFAILINFAIEVVFAIALLILINKDFLQRSFDKHRVTDSS